MWSHRAKFQHVLNHYSVFPGLSEQLAADMMNPVLALIFHAFEWIRCVCDCVNVSPELSACQCRSGSDTPRTTASLQSADQSQTGTETHTKRQTHTFFLTPRWLNVDSETSQSRTLWACLSLLYLKINTETETSEWRLIFQQDSDPQTHKVPVKFRIQL